jgi:hypothetical protein
MTTGVKIVLGVVLTMVVSTIMAVAFGMNAIFTANKFEETIIASDKQMQNVHGVMQNKLKTEGFTVQNYSETVIKTIQAGVQRYADKPQLMMQWIHENQVGPDKEVWTKLQTTIEASYVEFQESQKDKISKSQEYKMFLNGSVAGFVAKLFGKPSPEVTAIMDRVISSAETKEVWVTGEDKPVDMFKK